MKYKTLLIIGFIIGYIIITSSWGFYWAIHPPFKLSSTISPADFKLPYENINFLTQDKVRIQGWFIPSKKPNAKTIILLHGYPADKGDILSSRLFLHNDFNLLFIDFRYLGQSGGSYTTIGKQEILDLLGAIEYLKTKNINKVGVWGLSMGGAVALMTAKHTDSIQAIVAEASYSSLDKMLFEYYPTPVFKYPLAWLTRAWGILFLGIDIHQVSVVDAIKDLKIPILIIHSKLDNVIPFEQALLIQKALINDPQAEFIFANHLHHGELSQNEAQAIQNFFIKYLSAI